MSLLDSKNKFIRERRATITDGIFGTSTAGAAAPSSSLEFNPSALPTSYAAIPLASNIPTSTSEVNIVPPPTSTPHSSSSSSNGNIPLGTVIGACLGAFSFLILIILLALWYNRRASRAPPRRERASVSPGSRNADGNHNRQRSHLEIWDRLDDDFEEDQGRSKRIASTGPMDKLGSMFKRTPSTKSGEKSSEGHGIPESITPMQLAKYHPDLAQEMATPPTRKFMGRIDATPSVSWDGETVGDQSFFELSSGSVRESMSPIMAVAKSTPPATASQPHRWESAEVMHFDEKAEVEAEEEKEKEEHDDSYPVLAERSTSNPFFNAQEKAKATNPFADAYAATVPRPTEPKASMSNNERAMQSLIAALEVSPEEVHERLRVASMQTSFYSRTSTILSGDEEDITSVTSFPLPPTQAPWSNHY